MLRATVRHEVEVARQPAHVVAGLVERVERVGQLDRAVLALAHEEVLELGADHELEAHRRARGRAGGAGSCAGSRATPRPPRARRTRGAPRPARHGSGVSERTSGIAARSGSCGPWPISPAAKPGEAGAVLHQAVQVGGRHELRVRLAVHVHELREQELDVVVADVLAHVVARLGCGEWLVAHRRRKLSARRRTRPMCEPHIAAPNCAPPHVGLRHRPTLHSVVRPCVESPDSSPSRST